MGIDDIFLAMKKTEKEDGMGGAFFFFHLSGGQ